ncbi:hypothetical protein RGL65_001491 [Vibrio parahaemolyticus]|nr:hypothetical protein [Vibrio parahaemolyticus]ELA8197509.1 hypothetical protein [Vibrio parahaemolyticus]
MWDSYTKKLDITFLPTLASTDIVTRRESLPWSTIVSLFSKHDVRDHKDGTAFMPVKFKPESDWISEKKGDKPEHYRIDQNVQAITMAVFDLDEEGAMEQAEKAFAGFEYIMYSTHSYSKETPYKARILVKLDEPIDASNWNEFLWEIAQAIKIDEMCKNLSRNYLLPSISVDAGIAPMFKHSTGKSLTINDAKNIAKNFPREMSDDEREFVDKTFGKVSTTYVENEHFSGAKVNHYDRIGSSKDYDYESLVERHAKHIKELDISDKRHAFARGVTASEILAGGKHVDWYNVVQFIYRTTRSHGSKWLQHGNTPDELNDLILNGYRKFKKNIIDSDPGFVLQINKIVNAAKEQAEKSMSSNQWVFNAPPKKKDTKNIGEVFDKNAYTYEKLVDRHKNNLYKLHAEGDLFDFVISVYEQELDRDGEKTDLNTVGQFALFSCLNYIKKTNKTIDEFSSDFGVMLTKGLDIDFGDQVPVNKVPLMKKFVKTSVFLGYQCMVGNKKWDLKRERSPDNTPSR